MAAIDTSIFSPNSYVKNITNNTAMRNVARYDCCPAPYIDLTFTFDFILKDEATPKDNAEPAEDA